MILKLQERGIGGGKRPAQVLGQDMSEIVGVGGAAAAQIVAPLPQIHGPQDHQQREAADGDGDDTDLQVIERLTDLMTSNDYLRQSHLARAYLASK